MSGRERIEHKECDGCDDGIQIYTLSESSPRDAFLKVEEWTEDTDSHATVLWFCSWDCAVTYTTGGEQP